MASFTPNKALPLPTTDSDTGLWGPLLDQATSIIDTALGGTNAIVTTGGTVAATQAQAQPPFQLISGGLTSNLIFQLPASGAFYIVRNSTTGPYTVTVTTSVNGAGSVVVPQGSTALLWCDGTNIAPAAAAAPAAVTWQQLATYSVSGALSQVVPLPTSYVRYRLTLAAVGVSVAGAKLNAAVSTNGGASFVLGGGYNQAFPYWTTENGVGVTTDTNGSAVALTTPLLGGGANWDGTVEIFPGGAGVSFVMRGNGYGVGPLGVYYYGTFGARGTTVLPINALLIAPTSGIFSAGLILEGLL